MADRLTMASYKAMNKKMINLLLGIFATVVAWAIGMPGEVVILGLVLTVICAIAALFGKREP